MPTPHVISILDPAQLLDRAVDGLFPIPVATPDHPWPTLSAWVVLRQGGLRDDLHRLAAEREVAGWFDSPICLFSELSRRWGSDTAARPLTDAERHAILSGLIDRFGGTVFGRAQGGEAWVPAVDHLLGELMSEGIDADAFQRAAMASADDQFSRDRAEALGRIYMEWLAALERTQRGDGRDGKVRLAREIAADPTGFAERLGGRRDVRFVGLADLRGGWRPLLTALAASAALDRLEIITTFPLELPAELGAEYQTPGQTPTFAGALFSDATFSTPTVRLIEAPDAAREVETIAVRVRALLDRGVTPSRIAVVARQARPLVNEMAAALAKLGVPVTARRRTALSHTGAARALQAILAAASESFTRHSIVELAENPLLATGLDPVVVNFVGFARQLTRLDEWHEAFAQLLARCEARDRGEDSEDEHRQTLPRTEHVASTLAAWRALAPRLAELEGDRPLADWFAWVSETLRDGAWGLAEALAKPLDDREVWQADVRAADLIAETALVWHDALETFGGDAAPVDAAAFAGRFGLLLDEDLITPPETDFGVAVGEALSLGWRAFDHVFVIGLAAGEFPQRSATGGILDADDRRALIAAGLPLDAPDAWRGRESELFRVVCAGAREVLTLSWPVMDAGGRDVARSAFADEAAAALARAHGVEDDDDELVTAGVLERMPTNQALVPGFPVARDAAAVSHARQVAEREKRRTLEPSPWNGEIEDPALQEWLAERYGESFVWSATQLELVAKCRWHWFAQRLLHLDPQADADDLMEPTVRGSLVHDVLDRFFSAARDRMGGPAFLRETDLAWARELMSASLRAAWEAAVAEQQWLGPVALYDVALGELAAELQGYLDFEVEWNEKSFNNRTNASKQIRTGAVEGEYAFNDVHLSGDGVEFRLRGSIDRVDRGVDERVEGAERYIAAIDYKSTKYSTPAAGSKKGWDDGVVLQVPLYAAALQQLRPDDLLARMEYRTIRKPESIHSLSLAPLKKGEVQDAPDAEEKLAAALDAAGRRIAQVRAGTLPADPAPSCGCSPYCPARDVCRIPGGPVEVGR